MSRSSKSSTPDTVWKRMLRPGSKWEDEEEFLDVIYWGRQIVAFIIGLIWGYLGLTGFFGISTYVMVNSAAIYIYSVNFNEDTDEMMEYIKEGFMTSFSAFMVAWIMSYSALSYQEL